MYTKQIILEDLVLSTGSQEGAIAFFKERQRWWSGGLMIKAKRVYSKVENPLWFKIGKDRIESYYRAVLFLLKHELWYEISVKRGGDLVRIYAWEREDITDSRIRKMAKMAANDKMKISYFSVKYKKEDGTDIGAKIEFAEYNHAIIGYEVCVPFVYKHLFCIRTEQGEYYWNNGLWVPPNYKNLSSPFVGQRRARNR